MQKRKPRLALKPFSCSSRRTAELVPAGTYIPQQALKQALKMVWIWKPPAEVSPNQGRSSKALSRRERVLNESEMSLLPSKHRPDSQVRIRRQRRARRRRGRRDQSFEQASQLIKRRSSTEAELRTSKHDILLLPHPLKFPFHRAGPIRGTSQGRQWASADGNVRILQVTSDVELNDVVVQTGVKQFDLGGVLPYPAVAERALRVGAVSRSFEKNPSAASFPSTHRMESAILRSVINVY